MGEFINPPQVSLAEHSHSTATISELTMNHGISCESFKYEILPGYLDVTSLNPVLNRKNFRDEAQVLRLRAFVYLLSYQQ